MCLFLFNSWYLYRVIREDLVTYWSSENTELAVNMSNRCHHNIAVFKITVLNFAVFNIAVFMIAVFKSEIFLPFSAS